MTRLPVQKMRGASNSPARSASRTLGRCGRRIGSSRRSRGSCAGANGARRPRRRCGDSQCWAPPRNFARQIASFPADLPIVDEYLEVRDPDIVKITYDEHNWGIRPLIPILSTHTLRGIID